MTDAHKTKTGRAAAWASFAFYALIAFEFFYMASPFAAYFYGVYGPGLNMLSDNRLTSGLMSFFMPHIAAETKSGLINIHTYVGLLLFTVGLVGFVIGAIQVYIGKLRKSSEISGGLYKWIRHPQYLALMISSFGMMLIWPRFLVLLGFTLVVFVYIILARSEEARCLQQYEGYRDYKSSTGMFFPRPIEAPFRSLKLPTHPVKRTGMWAGLLVASMCFNYVIALAVQNYSIGQLYTVQDERSVTLSVGALTPTEIENIRGIAIEDAEIAFALSNSMKNSETRFINYVLPSEVFISEIPMHLPAGTRTGHMFPAEFDRNRYKIIFTQAVMRPGHVHNGLDILSDAINKTPIIEAWVSLEEKTVEARFPPPQKAFYDGLPVPVF